jgi:hypothetical protein
MDPTNPSSTSVKEEEDWARVGHPGAMGKEERGREVTGNECLRKIIDSRRWLKAVELTCWDPFNAQHSQKGKEDKVKKHVPWKKAKGNNPNHPPGTKQLFGEEVFGEKQNVRRGGGVEGTNIRANLGAASVVIVKEEGSPTQKKNGFWHNVLALTEIKGRLCCWQN